MILGKKHNEQISYCLIAVCMLFVLFSASNAFSAAVAPGDEQYANAVCSTDRLTPKQKDETECNIDNRCAGASGCIDATPVAGVNRVSSPFGERIHPITGKRTNHKGIDYAATAGTPIYAAADGCLTSKRYQYNASTGTGYGNMIDLKVDDPAGVTVRYAHMSCFADTLVPDSSGKICVKKGQIIGFVGNTGGSTGAHLHYEIQKDGKAIDPLGESSSDVMCTVDDTIKKMDDNAKSGGNGSAGAGESYGTGTPHSPENIGFIDTPERDGYTDKDCMPSRFREKYETCIFCNLFRAAFLTASNIAKASYDTLAPWILKLMSMAFAVWMAFQIIRFVSSMESKDTPTLLRSLFNQTFVFMICYFLLSGGTNQFMQLAMEPIFNTGFKLAQLVMSGEVASCDDEFDISSSLEEGGLPASMGISILCTIKVVQDKLLEVITAGSAAMCIAFWVKAYIPAILPHPAYLFSGLGLWIAGMLLLLIFPFLMLDAVLQLAVSCALLPAAIAAFAFKATRNYVIKVWESFLKAMFSFIFLTIIMMILITIIDTAIGESHKSLNAFTDQGTFEVILNDLSWTGVLFLKLVFVCLLGWAVLGQIAQFAGKFASSVASTNIGAQLGTLGYSGAKNMATRVAGPALKKMNQTVGPAAALQRGKEIASDAADAVHDWRQSRKVNQYKSGVDQNKTGYSAITDDEGNTTYSYADSSGKEQNSITVNKDGNVIANSSKQKSSVRNREQNVESYAGGDIEIKTTTKAGNEVKRDINIKDEQMKNMLNADGKINMNAVKKLRSTEGVSQETADEIILMSVMEQRMPDEMKKLNFSNNIVEQGKITRNQDGSISLTKIEKDGQTHEFKLQVDRNTGYVTTRYIRTSKADKNGVRKSTEMFSNGVFESVITNKVDPDGKVIGKPGNKKFGVNRYYANQRPAIDREGNLRKSKPGDRKSAMPAEKFAFAGMSEKDIEDLKKQYKENPQDTQNEEFTSKLDKPMFSNWGSYLRRQGRAILDFTDEEKQGLSIEEIEELKRRRIEGSD